MRCDLNWFKSVWRANTRAHTQRAVRECERGTVEIISCRKEWQFTKQSIVAESLLSFAVANSMWMLMRHSNMELHNACTFEYSFRYYNVFIHHPLQYGKYTWFFSPTKPNQKKISVALKTYSSLKTQSTKRSKCKEILNHFSHKELKSNKFSLEAVRY